MNSTADILRELAAAMRSPRLRSLREFASAELRLTSGQFAGMRFDPERQPFTGLWLDAVDSGRWRRVVTTGPTQSGKTLLACVLPVLYHLFECRERVIFGLPSMDFATDKWKDDLLPNIEATRYRELLPRSGPGAKGGTPRAIHFTNGAVLRFMTGGSGGRRGDKARAGWTSRVVVITETDGMDERGSGSEETDKIAQLEARTRSWGAMARIYMECTVTVESGRTWREIQAGTASRILLPCPRCAAWVSPERENLVGWRDAADKPAAIAGGRFSCPACRGLWTEEERAAANLRGRLIHRGQTLAADGAIEGEPAPVDTLGFRWSAAHNLLISAGDVAGDEWRGQRAEDQDAAERELRQFVWAVPFIPETLDVSELTWQAVALRVGRLPRGVVPAGVVCLGLGCDVGKEWLHWALIAVLADGSLYVPDYGRRPVPWQDLGEEGGLRVALRELRDEVEGGWPCEKAEGGRMKDEGKEGPERPSSFNLPTSSFVDQVLVDSGWRDDVVFAFCREAGRQFLPSKGFGTRQIAGRQYRPAKQTSAAIAFVGEHYHLGRLPKKKMLLVEVDADHWKGVVHGRLGQSRAEAGALTLFDAPVDVHKKFAQSLCAEKRVVGKRGLVEWEMVHRDNHWLDALALAAVAAAHAGRKVEGGRMKDEGKRRLAPKPPARTSPPPATPPAGPAAAAEGKWFGARSGGWFGKRGVM